MQYYPDDAEFINKEINDYGWMRILWGAPPKGRPATTCYANAINRAVRSKIGEKTWSAGSSKSVADENSDDDFMPPKRAQVRRKARKVVADENSDDDFMPPKRA